MNFDQRIIDEIMSGAKALSDCLFEQRVREFTRHLRDDCGWSPAEIAEWQREAKVAYTIWRTTELAMIEEEFFPPSDEQPEPAVVLQ